MTSVLSGLGHKNNGLTYICSWNTLGGTCYVCSLVWGALRPEGRKHLNSIERNGIELSSTYPGAVGGDSLCEDVGEDSEEGALNRRREEGGEMGIAHSHSCSRSWSWSSG